MKKLFLLTKTLLVAVMLLAGTNAWADATTVYERGYTTDWSNSDVGTGNWVESVSELTTVTSEMMTFAQEATNGSRNLTNSSISHTSGYVLTYDIVWGNGTALGGNGNYTYLKLGNGITFTANAQDQVGQILLEGNDPITISNACSKSNGNREDDVWTIHLVVNTSTNKVTELTIAGSTGTTKVNYELASAKTISSASSISYTSLAIGWYRAKNKCNFTTNIQKVKIQEEPSASTTASVTFKYEDTSDGDLSDLKADVVTTQDVGSTISEIITAAYTSSFLSEDENTKYVYSTYSCDDETVPAGGTTVTLKFAPKAKFTHTIQAVDGSSNVLNASLATGSAYAGEDLNLYWNKYIYANSKWYVTETLGGTYTSDGTTNISYSESDINYFYEFEGMTISRSYGDGYRGTWASNGRAITLYGGANANTESTVSAGVYTISLNGKQWQSDYSDTYEVAYSTDKKNWIPVGNISYPDGEEGVKSLEGAIIPEASYIRIRATMGSQTPRWYLDYLTLKKTADLPSTENIVVTSASYATYVSNYNLDFSSATTKAYKVSVADEAIATLTEVSKVPAKTPVLLYVAGGNGSGEAIPVTTDAVSAVSGNNLVAGAGVAVAYDNGDGKYNYVLDNQDDVVGFYKAAGLTVPVGRAYLQTTYNVEGAGARGLRMVFAGDITGINEAKAEAAAEKDGKFVINGQLVIKKNGKMFNAAGAQMK